MSLIHLLDDVGAVCTDKHKVGETKEIAHASDALHLQVHTADLTVYQLTRLDIRKLDLHRKIGRNRDDLLIFKCLHGTAL